ncbi:MAG: hypothetical protein L6R42_004892 [Xanthoria sp. 1 TBL-2021]|nr:MAG: hypothetical protein L6R42_004892 [Xanthoria sp. 1 TBL-2021]
MDPPRYLSSRTSRFSTQLSDSSEPPSASISSQSRQPVGPASARTCTPAQNILQKRKRRTTTIAPNDFLGQMSLAPATQTTVVTTTTTTTTEFPPLVIKAPRNVHDLDPVDYPLARLRTPASLRNVQFTIGDQTALLKEADDTIKSVNEWEQQQAALRESKGVLRSTTNLEDGTESWTHRTRVVTNSHLKRPLSPVSISEAARIAGQSRPRKRRHRIVEQSSVNDIQPEHYTIESSRASLRRSSRSTPNRAIPQLQPECHSQRNAHEIEGQSSRGETFRAEASSSGPQTLSPRSEVPSAASFLERSHHLGGKSTDHDDQLYITAGETREDSDLPGAVTPVRTEDDVVDQHLPVEQGPSTRPLRPTVLDTTTAQDMSLPSPSLSPVTAALNLRNRASYFDESVREGHRGLSFNSTVGQSQGSLSQETVTEYPIPSQNQASTPQPLEEDARQDSGLQPPNLSMMSIPNMIDTLEAMPLEMQEFVMYQLLKRCSKPVLKFVADVVNPALKCDFLSLLPLELSLNIVGHLDVKSLCRAAQVSRKWRQIIDSDEEAWKRLFDADGYTIPDGELQRAIREGWGWQHASQPNDWEQDLAALGNAPSDSEQSVCSHHVHSANPKSGEHLANDFASTSTTSKRSKRKTASKAKGKSRKRQMRHEAKSVTPMPSFDADALLDAASGTEGPYAAASAAAKAVPCPKIGLPHFRNLHLFKSIYQRHHIIRRSWMQDNSKPKHIAFRAHQRHVVTCLQFDTDKILTGSDDTNINVYDTQTGALRKKLTGHEGGVWALQYEGNVLVSGSTDRSVRVWDIELGKCTQVFQGHTSTVRCLQILMPTEVGRMCDGQPIMLPQQPLIITGSRDSNLRVWKLPKPGDPEFFQAGPPLDDSECPYFVRVLTGHHHSVRAIAAHADTLVSGSYDCTVRVWKISTGETVHRLSGHTQKVYSVVLDPRRNRCISGSMDNMVKVWSLDTGSALYNLEGHSSLVGLLDLQHDRLVSAAADSTLRIWDPETGGCRATLKAHTGAITCFQHDGQKVISGSDRTLKMWNVANGKFVKDLLTDLSGVWQVNFNERRCVAAVQRNGLTYIEVLDFGAARDGVPESQRGHRIVVDVYGHEAVDEHDMTMVDPDHIVIDE